MPLEKRTQTKEDGKMANKGASGKSKPKCGGKPQKPKSGGGCGSRKGAKKA